MATTKKAEHDLAKFADDLVSCADALTDACSRLGKVGSTGHVQTLQRVEPQIRALAVLLDENDTEILAALEAAPPKDTKNDDR